MNVCWGGGSGSDPGTEGSLCSLIVNRPSQEAPLQLIHGANVNFTLLHVAFNCSTFLVRVVLATNVKKCVRRSVDETRKREHEGAAPGVKQDIIALRA